jgi:serine/threonine protein kinase
MKGEKIGPYTFSTSIGSGHTGTVYLATRTDLEGEFAVKVIPKRTFATEAALRHFEKQLHVMARCCHPNVLFLLDFLEDQSAFYLVTEFCPGGDLARLIRDARYLNEADAKRYFRQIIDGVTALHALGFAHRDIKPSNLLLDSRGLLRLSDFDFAADTTDAMIMSPQCGTVGFTAPEVTGTRNFDPLKADVWSCGNVLFMMVTGRLPWPKGFRGEVQDVVVPPTVSPGCAVLIQAVLKLDPERRLDLAQIAAHAWLKGAPVGSKLISTMGLAPMDPSKIADVLYRYLLFLNHGRDKPDRPSTRSDDPAPGPKRKPQPAAGQARTVGPRGASHRR